MPTVTRRSRHYWLNGLRPYLISWRLRGTLVWLSYKLTFGARWMWARHVFPGELLVSTDSADGADALTAVIRHLRRGGVPRLYRVLEADNLKDNASAFVDDIGRKERGSRSVGRTPVAAAWRLRVRPGTEQAVLREIEYTVATYMARQGGFERIGRRSMLAVGRAAIAANQSRRGRLESRQMPPGPIILDGTLHPIYRTMLGLSKIEPNRQVEVAVLDSAVHRADLPDRTRERVRVDYGPEFPENRPPFAHGAVTTAVIGDIAENARITVYPVVPKGGGVSEASVVNFLVRLRDGDVHAEVIVLCFGFQRAQSPSVKTDQDNLRRHFQRVSDKVLAVVSTGNTKSDIKDRDVLEPAWSSVVYAVGAVNQAKRRSRFSRSVFPEGERPKLYLLAPGGDRDRKTSLESSVTANGSKLAGVGTSVAAAYAAGVVVRALGAVNFPTPVRSQVTEALRRSALRVGGDADAGPFCDGVIQQPPPGWYEIPFAEPTVHYAPTGEQESLARSTVLAGPADTHEVIQQPSAGWYELPFTEPTPHYTSSVGQGSVARSTVLVGPAHSTFARDALVDPALYEDI